LSANVGWAWWHHSKLYVNQFNEPIPKWVNDIQIYNRLRLIKLVTRLNWRLPGDVLPDPSTDEGVGPVQSSK
jgi:hypothetical protein